MGEITLERAVYNGIGVTGKRVMGKLLLFETDTREKSKSKTQKRSKDEEKKRLKASILKTVEKTRETSSLAREN